MKVRDQKMQQEKDVNIVLKPRKFQDEYMRKWNAKRAVNAKYASSQKNKLSNALYYRNTFNGIKPMKKPEGPEDPTKNCWNDFTVKYVPLKISEKSGLPLPKIVQEHGPYIPLAIEEKHFLPLPNIVQEQHRVQSGT